MAVEDVEYIGRQRQPKARHADVFGQPSVDLDGALQALRVRLRDDKSKVSERRRWVYRNGCSEKSERDASICSSVLLRQVGNVAEARRERAQLGIRRIPLEALIGPIHGTPLVADRFQCFRDDDVGMRRG